MPSSVPESENSEVNTVINFTFFFRQSSITFKIWDGGTAINAKSTSPGISSKVGKIFFLSKLGISSTVGCTA